jgi:hypothetical protein
MAQLLSPRKASNKKTLPIHRHGCAGSGQGGLLLDALSHRLSPALPFWMSAAYISIMIPVGSLKSTVKMVNISTEIESRLLHQSMPCSAWKMSATNLRLRRDSSLHAIGLSSCLSMLMRASSG